MVISVGEIVTNGAVWGQDKEPYLYQVLAVNGDQAWVRHLNGTFKGQRLTFDVSALVAKK